MDVPTNWLIIFCVIRVKPKSNHTGNRFSESIISAPLHFTHILIFNWHICRISPSCVYPKWNQWVKMCRPVDEIVTSRARRVVMMYLPIPAYTFNTTKRNFETFSGHWDKWKKLKFHFLPNGQNFFPQPIESRRSLCRLLLTCARGSIIWRISVRGTFASFKRLRRKS